MTTTQNPAIHMFVCPTCGGHERRLDCPTCKGDRVVGEEHLLGDRKQRLRDVRQGPDGALYVVTDQPKGELWKITPR